MRSVFVIDDKSMIRALIYYPMNAGRNIDEILRLLDALQTADKHGVACPANWRPGDNVVVPAPRPWPTSKALGRRQPGSQGLVSVAQEALVSPPALK